MASQHPAQVTIRTKLKYNRCTLPGLKYIITERIVHIEIYTIIWDVGMLNCWSHLGIGYKAGAVCLFVTTFMYTLLLAAVLSRNIDRSIFLRNAQTKDLRLSSLSYKKQLKPFKTSSSPPIPVDELIC